MHLLQRRPPPRCGPIPSVTPPARATTDGSHPVEHGRDDAESRDVILEVPELSVDSIGLTVSNVKAHVSLDANAMNLVQITAGVDVGIKKVELGIVGVYGEVYLYVDLDNIARIVDRVVASLDRNPGRSSDPNARRGRYDHQRRDSSATVVAPARGARELQVDAEMCSSLRPGRPSGLSPGLRVDVAMPGSDPIKLVAPLSYARMMQIRKVHVDP